jgi:hypothetical protein
VAMMGVLRSGLMPTSLGQASLRNESADGEERVVKRAKAMTRRQCFEQGSYR